MTQEIKISSAWVASVLRQTLYFRILELAARKDGKTPEETLHEIEALNEIHQQLQ